MVFRLVFSLLVADFVSVLLEDGTGVLEVDVPPDARRCAGLDEEADDLFAE